MVLGQPHPDRTEPDQPSGTLSLNALRAGVLGANDGIVSVAGIVLGVAGATTDRTTILTAGVAGLVAGALSMAVGEYVSVSAQRDSERAVLERERREIAQDPAGELRELTEIYEDKGLSPAVAEQVAAELTQHDAFAAHAEAELGLDPHDLVSPLRAATSSLVAFVVGALLPLAAILLPPHASQRVPVTVVAVVVALTLTGTISARLGRASVRTAIARNVAGGLLAMAITYGIGRLIGMAV